MARISSVPILQASKVMGTVHFIMGAVASCFGVVAAIIMSTDRLVSALAALIAFPLAAGVLGFLGTALACWLYNQIAGWFGGIDVEIEEDAISRWYASPASGPE
jgi:uncharacterized membrane protein YfbV (UPF0208 family)